MNSEDDFDYTYDESLPIVNQMEKFAKENGYVLPEGWKVELAKDFQRNYERIISRTSSEIKTKWENLIAALTVE